MQFVGERTWEGKAVRDPIYGFIEIPDPLLAILDHKLFQRLRWVNQLPLEQLVYPSAQHSRFEHSLGTMWLALCAASYLYKNSSRRIDPILEEAAELQGLRHEKKLEQFYLTAAAAGLLHDVGHAPFSHTLEDAYGYTDQPVPYDHEVIGFHVCMKIIEELNLESEPFVRLLGKVMEKKLKYENKTLGDLPHIIRQLVDGPIDADKGDYVLRDSYHCGVTYGIYDFERLWMNVVLTDDSVVGVHAKGAVEAWSLRIARFRMHTSVYKHKIRNITDALLIQILARAFQLADSPEKMKKIVPVDVKSPMQVEQEILDFTFWSDSSLISSIYQEFGESYIHHRIEEYQKRFLGKLIKEYHLNEYPGLSESGAQAELKRSLMNLSVELDPDRISFGSIVYEPILAPVFEKDTQEKIRILDSVDSSEPKSLAEFLGFHVDPELPREQPGFVLQIFGGEPQKNRILEEVERELAKYSGL